MIDEAQRTIAQAPALGVQVAELVQPFGKLWLNALQMTVWRGFPGISLPGLVRAARSAHELRPQFIPVAEHGTSFINKPVVVGDREFFVTCLSVGNPHAVTFVDDVEHFDLEAWGPKFENHPLFPEKVNAEFVQILDEHTLRMRVWERGCGETMACGTGATASMAAASLCGHVGDAATLRLNGGDLLIEWDKAQNRLYMTGPAVTVFDGELYL